MTSLDDYQFLQSLKGKRLKLKTNDESFIGVVQRILNKTIILEDVKAIKSSRQHAVRHFHGREILGVEFLRSTEHINGSNTEAVNGEGNLTIAEYQPYKLDILQEKDDDEYVNYVVINEFHQKFLPAVMEIQRQKVIGVGADGIGGVYLERLCWLQIATKNRVFLFDMLALGAIAFKNGLTKILANDRILKVAHDCRRLAACLIALYGVKLMNVFDTQVADFLHFYRQTGGLIPDRVSTMQEVVSLHLGMPASHLSSLNIKSRLSKEDREVWYMRPCPEPLLKLMALSVIHLLPLRQMLLGALLSDYTSLVDSYLASVLFQPVQMQDIGQDSGLELSPELCELEQMQQERQALALEYYPSTTEGRLVRFMPRSNSNSSTSAEAAEASSSHSHTSSHDESSPLAAGSTEAPHGPTPPSGSPTPTPTPYATPPSHTPDTSTPHPPTPHAMTPHAPTPHAMTPHAPTLVAQTGCAPTPCGSNSTELPTPYQTPGITVPTPGITIPTHHPGNAPAVNLPAEAVLSYPPNQSQGAKTPVLAQTILSMKPRVLSTATPKMEALPKQWPQTFPPESSASSSPARLLEVVMDTMAQSTYTAAEGAGQSSIGSYFNLGRGLQLQRAAFSNQVQQHTVIVPPSPTSKVAGSKGSVASSDASLKPMAAMAGVAQKIGAGKPSATPPLDKEMVLQKGPIRPSALSLAFSSFRMAS
ncbi:piRNA biogenesis protein EXD1 isoform X2 [Alosa sapidissima]|uniref:piRNA biogenesis protein EXD1 isoform X2 n=1 Tax=Alosa sapidissima TaxID=34773 RepID=UPI001C08DCF9|nr:piRNA biogenesis protein EXD1 isoform X2 [Alosa sapidissima]